MKIEKIVQYFDKTVILVDEVDVVKELTTITLDTPISRFTKVKAQVVDKAKVGEKTGNQVSSKLLLVTTVDAWENVLFDNMSMPDVVDFDFAVYILNDMYTQLFTELLKVELVEVNLDFVKELSVLAKALDEDNNINSYDGLYGLKEITRVLEASVELKKKINL